MAKLETSNLLDYTPNQLKLLLRGIKLVEQEEQASVDSRKDMLNGEDLSVPFAKRQLSAIKEHRRNLEDCVALKIALGTNLNFVVKHEITTKQ